MIRMNNIEHLIPQRPPMVVVDSLLHCNRLHTKTTYRVLSDSLFIEQGRLTATGLIENMAQTCAARMGYLALYGDDATGVVRKGVIGAIRNLHIQYHPVAGSLLTTSVDLIEELGDMILVKATVEENNESCVHCNMIVSLI